MDWKDVTIEQSEEIRKILSDIPKETDAVIELDKRVKLISILTGKTEDEIFELPLPEFVRLGKEMMFVYRQPKVKEPESFIEIEGIRYDFHPSVEKMSTGQYVDLTASLNAHPVNIAFLMSCVYIPHKKRYAEGYDISHARDALNKHASILTALSAANFFLLAFQSLTESTLRFLNLKLRRAQKTERDLEKKVHIKNSIDLIQDSLNAIHGSSPLKK